MWMGKLVADFVNQNRILLKISFTKSQNSVNYSERKHDVGNYILW